VRGRVSFGHINPLTNLPTYSVESNLLSSVFVFFMSSVFPNSNNLTNDLRSS